MELRPKARKKDVEMYIESCRTKFGCFETGGPGEDLAGKYIIQISHPSPFLLAKFFDFYLLFLVLMFSLLI